MGQERRIGKGNTAVAGDENTVEEFQPGRTDDKTDRFKAAPPGNPAPVPYLESDITEVDKRFGLRSQPVYPFRLNHPYISNRILQIKGLRNIFEEIQEGFFLVYSHEYLNNVLKQEILQAGELNRRKPNPKEGVYHRKNLTQTGLSDERIIGNIVSALIA
jgi:hypothetical protein